jgi:hypothetical protein
VTAAEVPAAVLPAAAVSSSSSMLTDPRVRSSKKLTMASLTELVGEGLLLPSRRPLLLLRSGLRPPGGTVWKCEGAAVRGRGGGGGRQVGVLQGWGLVIGTAGRWIRM